MAKLGAAIRVAMGKTGAASATVRDPDDDRVRPAVVEARKTEGTPPRGDRVCTLRLKEPSQTQLPPLYRGVGPGRDRKPNQDRARSQRRSLRR